MLQVHAHCRHLKACSVCKAEVTGVTYLSFNFDPCKAEMMPWTKKKNLSQLKGIL